MNLLRAPMTLVMLAIFASMTAIAATYPPDARFMPFVVGIPGTLLCLLQLALDYKSQSRSPHRKDKPALFEQAQADVSRMAGRDIEFEVIREQLPAAPEIPTLIAESRERVVWGFVVGFLAGVLLLGFWVAIPVFLAAFLRHVAGIPLRPAAMRSGVATLVIWLVFTFGLKVALFNGLIYEYLLTLG